MKSIRLGNGQIAQVDDEDYDFLMSWTWQQATAGYPTVQMTMHRLLLQPPKGMYVDHIDGDPLNNQRSNLRVCTPQENARNSRKHSNTNNPYKGVTRQSKSTTWRARLVVNGKEIVIGAFRTPEQAAMAYDMWALHVYGPFARTNFVPAI